LANGAGFSGGAADRQGKIVEWKIKEKNGKMAREMQTNKNDAKKKKNGKGKNWEMGNGIGTENGNSKRRAGKMEWGNGKMNASTGTELDLIWGIGTENGNSKRRAGKMEWGNGSHGKSDIGNGKLGMELAHDYLEANSVPFGTLDIGF
jgi:hypothetical protein